MIIAEELFRAALHLTAPWKISSIKFEEGGRKLDIWVDFPKGSRFSCPECNHLIVKTMTLQTDHGVIWTFLNIRHFSMVGFHI